MVEPAVAPRHGGATIRPALAAATRQPANGALPGQ